MIAVLPAAGRGTRMSSIGSGSKELLRVGRQSVIERVIAEARRAGCEEAVVVMARHKTDLASALMSMPVKQAVQEEPRGLAEAVLLGARLRPALVLLPDTVYHPDSPAPRLVKALSRGYDFAVAVQQVDDERVSQYGIVEWDPHTGRIARILEKPNPDQTLSRWAVAARFAISPRTLYHVQMCLGVHDFRLGEAHLTPFLDSAVAAGQTGQAVPLLTDERRFDCGNPAGFQHACEVLDGL